MDPVKALIESRPGFHEMAPACLEKAIPINDFIYMSSGTSNSYMVVTEAGRVIINTGMGFEARIHKKLYDAVCPGPTPYILITQGHVDHVGGVAHFREEGTRFVAQTQNGVCQRDDERIKTIRNAQSYVWFKHVFDPMAKLAAENPDLFVQDTPEPDICFDDTFHFSLGGVKFELHGVPGGETLDSCVIWLPQHRILFIGNVFGPLFPHFPNFNTLRGDRYRFVEPYLAALETVRGLEPELLITGHFDPIEGADLIHQSLTRMYDAVEYVHRETLKGMNALKDVWTLMKEVKLPPELEIGQRYGKVEWCVRTLWESYLGWFKLQSTTELYAVPAREVYADLTELAGSEAIVARGRVKLENDQPEAALHLAEVALEGASGKRPALELALAAHRALLERGGGINFWETGWLEHRIQRLQTALAER